MKYSLLLFSIILLLFSCKDEDFLDGFDRSALFAPPTQEELDIIKAEWATRDLSVKNYSVIQTANLPGNVTLKIISFDVSGFKEYAAIVVPPSTGKMPVRMWIGGFGLNTPVNSINLVFDADTFVDHPFIFAIPALRGQSLLIKVNGTEYTTPLSEGEHCEAFDGGADDGLALLNVIGETESMADVNLASVRGGSRGATVALLMSERDERIKKAVAVAGPVDLLSLTSQNENDLTYQCQFLDDIKNGSTTISVARLRMIASSPIYFAADLPQTQLHMAAHDVIVPVSQASELEHEMNSIGIGARLQVFIYADRDHSNIGDNNQEMNTRIEEFLLQF